MADFPDSVRFFFEQMAGCPTLEQRRYAVELAMAEHAAIDAGCSLRWDVDPDADSSEFNDDRPPWALWQCTMYDGGGNVVASFGACDFGRDCGPEADAAYRRVVEAQVAEQVDWATFLVTRNRT